MATLSIVALTYNKAWMFPRFLASLQAQTRRPDQFIFVDDASKDATPRYLAQLPRHYKVLRLAQNQGQSFARNLGTRYVGGDHVIFLDADILMNPTMLAVLETGLEKNPAASFAYGHYLRAGSRRDSVRARPWSYAALRNSNYVSMMSLIRRRHLPSPPFDNALRRYEDWDLWIRMAKARRHGVMVNHVLFTAYYQSSDLSGGGESRPWYRMVRRKHGFGT